MPTQSLDLFTGLSEPLCDVSPGLREFTFLNGLASLYHFTSEFYDFRAACNLVERNQMQESGLGRADRGLRFHDLRRTWPPGWWPKA